MSRNRIAALLASLFTLALLAAAVAPAAAAGNMVLNPQAGVTWSNFSFDDNEAINDESGRVGYGLGGNIRFGGKIYFAPGLYYQKTGFEATATDELTLESVTDVVGISSFQIPALVGFNLSAGATSAAATGFRVYGGPSLTVVTSVDDNLFGVETDDFESTIFGGVLGAGLDLTSLTFDLNYEIGMSEVFKDENSVGAKQNVLRGLVGLKF